jgi:large subunit ribosomal protein L22
MEVKAIAKFIKISPIKANVIRKSIVGKEVQQAVNILENIPKKSSRIIKKVVQSCFANAKQKNSDIQGWYIKNILINEGPKMKRIQSASMGRGVIIRKRFSHITVILDEQVINKKIKKT